LVSIREGAKDLVEEYYRVQGGRPEKPQPRKRKSTTAPKQTPEKTQPKKRRKSRADTATETPDNDDDADLPNWVPKAKNWEGEVKNVDTILRDPETTNLIAYLHWKNGKKSKVSLEMCYEKCPRKASLLVYLMLCDGH
jgi:chromobox protein 1